MWAGNGDESARGLSLVKEYLEVRCLPPIAPTDRCSDHKQTHAVRTGMETEDVPPNEPTFHDKRNIICPKVLELETRMLKPFLLEAHWQSVA